MYNYRDSIQLIENYRIISEQFQVFTRKFPKHLEMNGYDRIIKLSAADYTRFSVMDFEFAITLMPCIKNDEIYGQVLFSQYSVDDGKLGKSLAEFFISTDGDLFFQSETIGRGNGCSVEHMLGTGGTGKILFDTEVLLPFINDIFDLIKID